MGTFMKVLTLESTRMAVKDSCAVYPENSVSVNQFIIQNYNALFQTPLFTFVHYEMKMKLKRIFFPSETLLNIIRLIKKFEFKKKF